VTTTRRGWRSALDSSLLFTVIVCGSVSLLAAVPAAASVVGRAPAVASIGSGAASVAPGAARGVVDKGSPASCGVAVAARAVTAPSSADWLSERSEGTPRDSAEDDDADASDDDAMEQLIAILPARGVEARQLTHIDSDPSVSLESDGHSLRAPPQ
jgi:hypothetical protein